LVREEFDRLEGSIEPYYRVINDEGGEIAVVTSLENGIATLAAHASGNPAEPSCAEENNEYQYRIEHRLGETVADAAEAIGRAQAERRAGGVRSDTRETIARNMKRLAQMWEASRHGSYDADDRTRGRYFFTGEPSEQATSPTRISFDEAAYWYGKRALRTRLGTAVTDGAIQEMISNTLKILRVASLHHYICLT
jgi:hypothetical protein